jgi:hypothetical protein
VVALLIEKKWEHIDAILKDGNEYYQYCELGIINVNPQNIIALSLTEQEVLYSGKLERLKKSISEEGWIDKSPGDLHLLLLPNGYYSVCSGGNHRTYIANLIGIPKIKASVTLVIPNELINEEVINRIEEINVEKSSNFQTLRDIAKQQRGMVFGSKEYLDLQEKYNYIDRQINSLEKQVNNLLERKAFELGILPIKNIF